MERPLGRFLSHMTDAEEAFRRAQASMHSAIETFADNLAADLARENEETLAVSRQLTADIERLTRDQRN